jgi:hypothetical protein
MNSNSDSTTDPGDALREVKLAFMEVYERDRDLGIWLKRYPQYARQLIDLAMSLDASRVPYSPSEGEIAGASLALREALESVHSSRSPADQLGLIDRIRSAGAKVSEIATTVRIGVDILFKLDRGVIRRATVPQLLLEKLADVLGTSVELLRISVPTSPVTSLTFYYSNRPPDGSYQQTFAEALEQSVATSAEDRSRWLAQAHREGLEV